MPEYPDITVYIERLEALVVGKTLEQIRFASPFFLRTAEPPIKSIYGAVVRGFECIGKRIVFVFDRVASIGAIGYVKFPQKEDWLHLTSPVVRC
jgi:formamidopyrimidine-DNA glycosylase